MSSLIILTFCITDRPVRFIWVGSPACPVYLLVTLCCHGLIQPSCDRTPQSMSEPILYQCNKTVALIFSLLNSMAVCGWNQRADIECAVWWGCESVKGRTGVELKSNIQPFESFYYMYREPFFTFKLGYLIYEFTPFLCQLKHHHRCHLLIFNMVSIRDVGAEDTFCWWKAHFS